MPDLLIRELDPGVHARLHNMAEAYGQTLEHPGSLRSIRATLQPQINTPTLSA